MKKEMVTNDTPREFTREEVREFFLRHLLTTLKYWESLPDQTISERMHGLLFSTLVALDGGTALPGFIVAPCPHESDKEYSKEEGHNWFPQNHDSKVNCDIGGGLHDLLYKVREQMEKEEGKCLRTRGDEDIKAAQNIMILSQSSPEQTGKGKRLRSVGMKDVKAAVARRNKLLS